MGRAPCCDKDRVKKGPWSPEEDAKLKSYIEEHGTGGNWIALPQKIGLKRCGKSCRLRWLNYLRPNIKHGSFTEEEDRIIYSLYISIGSRWSIISAQLPGRTDNDIKNYWNTRLKKKLLGKPRDPISQSRTCPINNSNGESHGETNGTDRPTPSQSLSASALERMQLHLQLQGLRRRLLHDNSSEFDQTKTEKHSPFISPNYTHAGIESSDRLGFHPSLQSAVLSTKDYEIPNYDLFATAEVHGEIYDMLHNRNGHFGLLHHEDQQRMVDTHCSIESTTTVYGEESMNSWLDNGHGDIKEKPSPESWDSADHSSPQLHDALLVEYVQQLYDL